MSCSPEAPLGQGLWLQDSPSTIPTAPAGLATDPWVGALLKVSDGFLLPWEPACVRTSTAVAERVGRVLEALVSGSCGGQAAISGFSRLWARRGRPGFPTRVWGLGGSQGPGLPGESGRRADACCVFTREKAPANSVLVLAGDLPPSEVTSSLQRSLESLASKHAVTG